MSYTISELNGVKIYNLSAGKTTQQFLEEAAKKKTSLKYNQEYRNRIELIQDFDFPVASTQVQMTEDQRYIIAAGIYPPQTKIFETSELSMKCMRGMDSEVVRFNILSDDYSKLAFACADRTIEFHAQYGKHYRTRVPKFPRDMKYNRFLCDLFVGGASNEIYRLSLDEGKFLSPFSSASPEINVLEYNPELNLLMCGGTDGALEFWDYRERKKIKTVLCQQEGAEVSALGRENQSLLYAVGLSNGLVKIYDYRYEAPTQVLKHQYRLPIKRIAFHEKTRSIISADRKIIKVFNKDSGQIFTNIEPKNEVNGFEIVKESGLFLVATEEFRIGLYFIPSFDNAPKWCPYLENMTEELEEELNTTVYDEFKFLSYDDLEKLDATNMIGSKMVRQHMHGYLMHQKLYQKLVNLKDPFAYERYRKELIKKKLDEARGDRITLQKKNKVKVNQDLLKDFEKKNQKKQGKKVDVEELLQDERFGNLFTRPEFQIDKTSSEYLMSNPGSRGRFNNQDEEGYNDEEIEIEDDEQMQERTLVEKANRLKMIDKKSESKKSYEEKLKKINMNSQKLKGLKLFKNKRKGK